MSSKRTGDIWNISSSSVRSYLGLVACVVLFLWPGQMAADQSANTHAPGLLPETITIASEPDYPPYCLVDENGNAAGFSVELFQAAAAAVGLKVTIILIPLVIVLIVLLQREVKRRTKSLNTEIAERNKAYQALQLSEETYRNIFQIMPEMNGRDLADQLQALYPKLRVLFMSGYTDDVIAHCGILDSGVHFMPKPFSSQDLARKVREALEG